MHLSTRLLALTGAGALALGVTALPAQAATGDTATVYVLHAVKGLDVDVYANGDELIPDFTPGTLTDALELPAGEYDLQVFAAGADPETADPAIEANDVAVPAGANVTVVAHLDADGTPTLTPFVNDVSRVDPGQARVTVRHTAAAPAVDIRAGGTVIAPGLTNPNEASLEVAAGTISADVVLAGTDTVAIGPADLPLAEGTNTIVYAWGSAEDENLDLAVQTLTGLHNSPSGVPSGEAGLASTSDDRTAYVLLGIGGLAAGATLVAARRRTASVDNAA